MPWANEMEMSSNLVGKTAIITKRDGFKKAGTVVNVDPLFIFLQFERSGTVQAVPIADIVRIKVENKVLR